MTWTDVYLQPNQRRAARLTRVTERGQPRYLVKGVNLDGQEWTEVPSPREIALWLLVKRLRTQLTEFRAKVREMSK